MPRGLRLRRPYGLGSGCSHIVFRPLIAYDFSDLRSHPSPPNLKTSPPQNLKHPPHYSATVGFGKESGITSQNVVGYYGKNSQGLKKPSFGACFLPLDGKDTYKLGTLIPTDFDVDADVIQLINPTTLKTDALYVYLNKDVADAIAEEEGEEPGAFDDWIGWWDAVIGIGEDGGKADDVEIKVGQAFLGLFQSGNDIIFTSCGEVNATPKGVSVGTEKKPFFANIVPATLKLGQIVPENFDVDEDVIQVINPTTLKTDALYVYLNKEVADAIAEEEGEEPGAFDEWIGWWDAVMGVGEDGAKADDVDVAPGAAFLGLFQSGNEIIFNFPSVLK